GRLEFDDLPVDRRIRELVVRLLDGGRVFVAQHVAHAGRIVATVIAILMKDTDFWIWLLRENVSGVKTRCQSVARTHGTDRVGRYLVIDAAVGTALDEQLRDFSLVEVSRNLELRGPPNRPEHKGDVLHVDQLARLVPGPPRHEPVIGADQVDLAAIDAALIVD